MSTSEFDGRNDRLDVSRYAPPQYRMSPEEATIQPVLERLSRGLSDDNPNAEAAQLVLPIEPIQIQQPQSASPSATIPLSTTGRLAIAMSLVAALTAVSVTFFKSKADHPAPAAAADSRKTAATSLKTDTPKSDTPKSDLPKADMSKTDLPNTDMPKAVHTVSVRPEATTVGEAQASAATEQPAPPPTQASPSVTDRIEAIGMTPAEPQPETALALTEPLTLWTMFPSTPGAGPWGSSAGSSDANANAVKDAPEKTASAPQQTAKPAKHARRHRRRTVRRRAPSRQAQAAAAQPQPAQQAAVSEETPAKAAQPAKTFIIQSALDAIFGDSVDSNDSASDSVAPTRAPATTGTAFR